MSEKVKKYLPSFSDVLSVVGLGSLGYGLYLYSQWVSYSVVGGLLIIAGFLSGRHEETE